MQNAVFGYIKQNSLPLPPARLVVGVSGGADSVALLHLLVALGYDCAVAHCNFHLRGAESDRDEAFTAQLAESLQLPFHKTDFDTKTIAAERGISIEMAARDLRYEWFEQLRGKLSAQAIAVAHHTDDMIETLLMNLTRGTGLHGLTGIKPRNGNVIRPLLCVSRQEIEDYLKGKNIAFVTDSSNLEQSCTRNKFRHAVVPLLETINPAAKTAILNCINHLQETETLFNTQIEELKNRLLCDNAIDIPLLLKEKARNTVLYEILKPYHFNHQTVDDIIQSLTGESGRQFFSPTHRLLKDRDKLIIEKITEKKDVSIEINQQTASIETPLKMTFRTLPAREMQIEKDKKKAYFDADRLQFPLTLRHPQAGDSFVPFGMKGRKKLSDYFIDLKYSIIEKENALVLLSGKDIIWLVGERTDERFRITDATRQVLCVEIKG